MTGDRAGLAAQTFLLPQPKPQPVAPTAQPFNDGVQALEGLQYVKGQTADYYKKVADLKAFMQSVNTNLGLDVRVPDLSRPESIKLNQIYRDAIADIMNHGNALKQGASMNNMLVSRGDVMTDNYYGQPASMAEYGKDYFNRKLEDSIIELNNKLQMPSYTREEYNQKEAARQDAIKYWRQFKKDNPDKAEYADYQLRGISPTTQGQWRPQNETSWDRKQGQLDNAMEVAFRKAVNFLDAATPQWKISNVPIPGSPGQFYRVNTEYSGLKYGDTGVIDKALFNPQDNSIVFQLKDGQQVKLDKNDPIPMLQSMIDSNPRFGFTGAQMYDYMQRNNIFDGSGALNVTPFLEKPEIRQKEQERLQKEEADLAAKQSPIVSAIKTLAKDKKYWALLPNDRFTVPIKLGTAQELRFEARGNGTFNLENFDDLRPFYSDPKGEIDKNKRDRLQNIFKSEQPIEKIVEELLRLIPVNQYDALYQALGIKEQQAQATQSGTKSADTKPKEIDPDI